MAIQPVPQMTEVPSFPALSDRATGDYNGKAFAFGTHMAEKFNDEVQAVAASVVQNAMEAEERAASAELAAQGAAASLDAAIAISGAAPWVPGSFVAKGESAISLIDFHTYRKLVSSTTVADPSTEPSNWFDLTSANKRDAEIAVLAANAARADAEAARDAALIGSGVYATEAAGRAAVANGVAFKVQGSDDIAAYEYRRVGASVVSTLIATYPSAAAVATNSAGLSRNSDRATALEQVAQLAPTISLPTLGECASVTVNDAGVVLEAVTASGIKYVAQNGALVPLDLSGRAVTAPTINVPGIGSASVVYVDEVTGAVIGGATLSGELFHVVDGSLVLVGSTDAQVGVGYTCVGLTEFTYVAADPNIVDVWVVIGQSLGTGVNGDLDSATLSGAPQHVGYAYTFSNGAYVGKPPFNYPINALGGLRENPFVSGASGFWESICSRFGWTLLDKMQAAIGQRQKIFVCSSASGGRTFAQLSRGDPSYGRFLDHMKAAQSALAQEGYTPRLRGLLVVHGEADGAAGTSRSGYKKMLHTWRRWAEEDARVIFGKAQLSATVEMYVSQTGYSSSGAFVTPNVPCAQLDANDENPHTTCVGPIYWATKSTGDGHPSTASYARMGEQFADAVFNNTYSGNSFQPLHVVESYFLDATRIRLKYTGPVGVENSDSLIVLSTMGAGKGFEFFDGTATPPVVTGVSVISGSILEVTLSASSAGKTPRLYYACRRVGSDDYRVTGSRGGVRSSAAFMTSAITATPNYHWAAHQVINIGEMK